MTQIPVHAPRHWWRIAASDVPELVDRDPDVDDRLHGYRHPDRDEQRWDRIANAVSRVSDSLAAEEWTIEDDPEADDEILYAYVDVDLADLELTKIELEIVRGWFSYSHPVRADPWFDLQDGRRRLWLTAAHFTPSHKALVPVHGSEIMYATELSIPELGDDWHRIYLNGLDDLLHVDWFDRYDVVNERYVRALLQAAAGQVPRQR
jgi:hypothetical protein